MSLRDNLNEEAELAVGDSRYVLIPEKENFLSDIAFEADAADSEVPLLVLVYKTTAEQTITQSALREFRANVLDKDDVIRSEFWANVVFYGAEEKDINIAPEACDELAAWNVQTKLFAAGDPAAEVAPGPYVFHGGQTWQPWKIYEDFNACFMTSFKPSPDDPNR